MKCGELIISVRNVLKYGISPTSGILSRNEAQQVDACVSTLTNLHDTCRHNKDP